MSLALSCPLSSRGRTSGRGDPGLHARNKLLWIAAPPQRRLAMTKKNPLDPT